MPEVFLTKFISAAHTMWLWLERG